MNLDPKPKLKLDWCSYQAAKWAVEHWHYSRTMPVAKKVCIGCYENDDFIGVIIFSWGANPNLSKAYNLDMTQCAELVRVALKSHTAPVSRILSIAIKMFSKQSPGIRLIVSFADQREGHIGIIYQASNWIYTGETSVKFDYELDGKILQRRSYTGINFGGRRMIIPPGAVKIKSPAKHRYLMPLDEDIRKQVERLRKPYPKRGAGETDSAPYTSMENGGASPTAPLLANEVHHD